MKRVYEIAKELGVASKAIVDKCQAEGVPGVDTHMSPVKIGLEMTIRQWFTQHTAEEPSTAIETTKPVDLEKARRARRKRAKTPGSADHSTHDHDDAQDTAVAVEEPPLKVKEEAPAPSVEEVARQVAQPAKSKPKKAEETVEVAGETAAPEHAVLPPAARSGAGHSAGHSPGHGAAAHAPPSPPAVAAEAPRPQPAGRPNVPDRPSVVAPVGPKLEKPGQVTLRGPKVIRVEQPDVVAAPRRRTGGAGGGGGAGREERTPDGVVPGIARTRGPAQGRGAGGRAPEPEEAGAAKKRHARSPRRDRSAEALATGAKRLSEADYIEQQERLNRSRGIIDRHRLQQKHRSNAGGVAASPMEVGGKLVVREPITIKGLSAATGIKATDIIKWLFAKGIMATINSAIDTVAAMEVAMEYDIELEVREQETAEQEMLKQFADRPAVDVKPRPPVVTVLGHVDHGKTSLLDRIREADVAVHEAGGITQHIGAYRVTITGTDGKERTVVFFDTPGHEAFTSMRARGAKMTDMVVLVVAADDGVMPQTIESINHAKAAGVPIIVALNKIDKVEATTDNVRKIYGQLAEHGLSPVEWGGTTEVMKVSATKGTGITELLEMLDYQAELLQLKADYGGAARGTVIESQMQEGRGSVARILVQDGQLRIGDFIVLGRAYGRVRDMTDDRNRRIEQAGPATPVEISGIDMIPDAGDKFYCVDTFQNAQAISEQFRERERLKQLASQTKITLENLADQLKAGAVQELRVVLKADVQGSIDVLKKSLEALGNKEVGVRVLHSGVGGITESDVLLADASDAIVIGFHVICPAAVHEIANERHVQVRLYRIIYEATEDVTKALEGMLAPDIKEETVGEAEVREVFRISKLGSVAGCLVTSGSVIKAGTKMRLVRDSAVITEKRDIDSLRRVKEDVKEVRAGTECGIRLVGFDDIKPGDRLVCYRITEVKRKLE